MREWLGAMVTGGIVEYDPARVTYRLPPEHVASLPRDAGWDVFTRIHQQPLVEVERFGLCEREAGEVGVTRVEQEVVLGRISTPKHAKCGGRPMV